MDDHRFRLETNLSNPLSGRVYVHFMFTYWRVNHPKSAEAIDSIEGRNDVASAKSPEVPSSVPSSGS